MDDKQKGGELIGKGSYGYVFKPGFKCNNQSRLNKNNVSKIFFSEESLKEVNNELLVDSKIRNIKDYENWCHIWTDHCKGPDYEILYKKDKDIESCLLNGHISKQDFNKYSRILQGTYAGINLTDYINKHLNPTSPVNALYKSFLNIMKLMRPLFLGLSELYKHKIIHCDIKSDNIMVNRDGCKYIDFGLSSHIIDNNHFKKRSMSEFATDRIYPSYPYEYIYLFCDHSMIKEELDDIQYDIFRELHDRYNNIHVDVFKRKKIKDYLISLINRFIRDKQIIKNEKNKIISLLDTYSLGILIPDILCKIFKNNKIKLDKVLNKPGVKSFIELFYVMSEPDHYERINPNEAYRRYVELETLYLKHKSNKKTVKRQKRRDRGRGRGKDRRQR